MALESHYLVAWPEAMPSELELIPTNATELITDWQAGLDPVQELRASHANLADPTTSDWFITDRIVQVAWVDGRLIQEVARDETIREAFRYSPAHLDNPAVVRLGGQISPEARKPMRGLARRDSEDGPEGPYLLNDAIPVLLGLIILVTVGPGITFAPSRSG
jgi:hypothetical protein